MTTRVIHIRDSKKSSNEVYVGRDKQGNVPLDFVSGYYGNPVVKGKNCPGCSQIHEAAGDTLSCYSNYLDWRLETDPIYATNFKLLKDAVLICYCRPKDGFKGNLICHAQIMAGRLDGIPPDQVE